MFLFAILDGVSYSGIMMINYTNLNVLAHSQKYQQKHCKEKFYSGKMNYLNTSAMLLKL